MSQEPSVKLSPFAVFRNPSFTKMWLAQLISTVGDAFTMIAAGIYVFRLTGSALQVGLMLMAIVNTLYALSNSLAPAFVFITISGVLNAPWGVARRTLIQRNTERQVRGRVFGALLTIGHVFMLLDEVDYFEAPEGTRIVRRYETSDAAYFILEGGAVAGREEDGQERILEVLHAGDFFGEIAALTGIPRTANVVTDQPAQLLRVPAAALRQMSSHPEINRAFMSKMTERMVRMNMIELPKKMSLDQEMMRELRTPDPAVA